MATGCRNGPGWICGRPDDEAAKRIVIVGGGTAGWLAAMMLSDVAARKQTGSTVTVIESSKLGVIGVGEGSTAVFRQMLRHFGLDEMEFLRETGATIKYGIRHRDWRRLGHSYDGPIDTPQMVAGGADLDGYAVAAGRSVGEAHLFQHLLNGAEGAGCPEGRPAGAGWALPPCLSLRSGAGRGLAAQKGAGASN